MESIKLVCFDMDGTLIEGESWYALNLAFGVTQEEDAHMYEAYAAGMLSYDDWTHALLKIYKERGKANRETATRALSHYSLRDGARELVEHLKAKGYQLALISGSFDILVDLVADDLGIVYRQANTSLVFDDDGTLVDLQSHGDEGHAKLRHLGSLCKELELDITECACIGDSANDIELFKRTGNGIAFEGTPPAPYAQYLIKSLPDAQVLL